MGPVDQNKISRQLVVKYPEGSKSNIPYCARQVRATGARNIHVCDARTLRESDPCAPELRTGDVRHVARVHHANAAANLPLDERATRDVTFGPLCTLALSPSGRLI
jgi:hypothetical protein